MCAARYDIAFLTSNAVALISDTFRDTAILGKLKGAFRRIYKVMREKHVPTSHRCFPDSAAIYRGRIVAFPDAGLGAPIGNSSIETGYISWGYPVPRDGVIT